MKTLETKEQLFEKIFNEVDIYIGNSYADDMQLSDYLTIDKENHRVSHTVLRPGWKKDNSLDYYRMSDLVASSAPFLYVPSKLGIGCVVNNYFPSKSVGRFVELLSQAISSFINGHGYDSSAMIYYSDTKFIPTIEVPSEVPEITIRNPIFCTAAM